MRSRIVTGLLASAAWFPMTAGAQQTGEPADLVSVDTVPVQEAVDEGAVLQANVLREQAISVLDRRGPADLALAQLTRAALLDPKETETWEALERGSVQMASQPASTKDRVRSAWSAIVVRVERLNGLLATRTAHVRTAGLDFWATHRANPRSWAGFLFLTLLGGSIVWLVLRIRTDRRAAKALRAAAEASPVPPDPIPQEPTITPSADEQALKAYLDRRETRSGGTSETGILARA